MKAPFISTVIICETSHDKKNSQRETIMSSERECNSQTAAYFQLWLCGILTNIPQQYSQEISSSVALLPSYTNCVHQTMLGLKQQSLAVDLINKRNSLNSV